MFFLIDGHNLIPKIPGMSLESLDDELGLIKQLQIYCRISRDSVEVFFDRAAPGQAGTKNHGVVKVHFIPLGTRQMMPSSAVFKPPEAKHRIGRWLLLTGASGRKRTPTTPISSHPMSFQKK